MWFSALLLSYLLLLLLLLQPAYVTARFCEGGHICSLPRECCTQGCCPPYQGGPRQLPPPSEHVLNLFFISHWFFWCVVVAIILAILCAYSLWKKRRTLCGWGFTEHHTQSEGDSAGSCYAPPQYSRCNSFHHPPPPYTEVTSKPDLYPLVFTCNSDNGKGNGSSYLMVQYFRNYIVRPAGSLSAASTVDSLSSSFICNANEANTLVPPPYSRAASPDLALHYANHAPNHAQQQQQQQQHHSHQQQALTHAVPQYSLPRSASQLVCHNASTHSQDYHASTAHNAGGGYQTRNAHYATVALNGGTNANCSAAHYNTRLHNSESGHFSPDESGNESSSRSGSALGTNQPIRSPATGFLQSQSDQHFRYIANSNSSLSDIFVNNSCIAGLPGAASAASAAAEPLASSDAGSLSSLALAAGGTPVIYSNGCIKPNPLHRVHTNPTQFSGAAELNNEPVYNSCSSIGGISLSVPLTAEPAVNDGEYRDLHLLRRSLETCCQLLQQQQQQQPPPPPPTAPGSNSEPTHIKKYAGEEAAAMRSCSYVTSGTVSGVSSLANIGTPGSPPQATSPTGEVREILDQIRQLQAGVSYEELLLSGGAKPRLHHTLSTPASAVNAEMPAMQRTATQAQMCSSSKRPSTLQQQAAAAPAALTSKSKKFYSPKPNKALYIPMVSGMAAPNANRCVLKSPVSSVVSGANFFVNRGRARKGWISRSAPTTPGTALPPNRLGDDSPLLNEHDEDAEGEQNAELE